MSTIYMAMYERNEALRRARNAQFYVQQSQWNGSPATTVERWRDTVRTYVRNARQWNHRLLRLKRVRSRAEAIGRGVT